MKKVIKRIRFLTKHNQEYSAYDMHAQALYSVRMHFEMLAAMLTCFEGKILSSGTYDTSENVFIFSNATISNHQPS